MEIPNRPKTTARRNLRRVEKAVHEGRAEMARLKKILAWLEAQEVCPASRSSYTKPLIIQRRSRHLLHTSLGMNWFGWKEKVVCTLN